MAHLIKVSCGFSLIELMVVLIIVGIISVISVTGLPFFLKKSEAEVLSSQLMNAIDLSRREAMIRHEKIILCGSTDQIMCSDRWQLGYIIKTAHRVIYHFQNNLEHGILHWRCFPRDKQQLEFLSTGLSHSQNGTFWFCQENAVNPAWAIVVNKAARARWVNPGNDGSVRDDKGIALTC